MANISFEVNTDSTVDATEAVLLLNWPNLVTAWYAEITTSYVKDSVKGPEQISGEVTTVYTKNAVNGPEQLSGEINTGLGFGVNATSTVDSSEIIVLIHHEFEAAANATVVSSDIPSPPTSMLLGGNFVTWKGQEPPTASLLSGNFVTWKGQEPPTASLLSGNFVTWKGQEPPTASLLSGAIDAKDGTTKFFPTANATVESSDANVNVDIEISVTSNATVESTQANFYTIGPYAYSILEGEVVTVFGVYPYSYSILEGEVDTQKLPLWFEATANAVVESTEVNNLGFGNSTAKVLNGSVITTEATYNCVAKILSGTVVTLETPVWFEVTSDSTVDASEVDLDIFYDLDFEGTANASVDSSEVALNHWPFGATANATVESSQVSDLVVTKPIPVASIAGFILTNNLANIPVAGIAGRVLTNNLTKIQTAGIAGRIETRPAPVNFNATADANVVSGYYPNRRFIDELKGSISTVLGVEPPTLDELKGSVSTVFGLEPPTLDELEGSLFTLRGPHTSALFGEHYTVYDSRAGINQKLAGETNTQFISSANVQALFGELRAAIGPQDLILAGKTLFQNDNPNLVDRLSGKTNFTYEAYLPLDRLSGKTYFYESSSKVVGLHGGFIAYPGVRNAPVMAGLHGDVLVKYGIHDYRAQGLHGYLYCTVKTIVSAFSSLVTTFENPSTTDSGMGSAVTTFEDIIDRVTGYSSSLTRFEDEIKVAVAFSSVDTNPPGAFDVLNGKIRASHYIDSLTYEQQEALNGKVKALLVSDVGRTEALNGEFLTILATLIYYQVARTYIGVEPPDEPE